ncbi:MAG: hypothetical protein EZS28_042548 [Streblomastix strix]|uniref:SH3 domain-containing protein n=1 Tax=Streblomastix strix TaxID=222440 RepID=A0A5J4TX00_9EUKA|nr:MAG: hypothetical protein EZS28_042548 [Streblomastix strix]
MAQTVLRKVMTTENELFEVLYEYRGREVDSQFISVDKGDLVRVIKKEDIHYIVDKDRTTGKVRKRMVETCSEGTSAKNNKTNPTTQNSASTNFFNYSMVLKSLYVIQYKPNVNVAQHQMFKSSMSINDLNFEWVGIVRNQQSNNKQKKIWSMLCRDAFGRALLVKLMESNEIILIMKLHSIFERQGQENIR